jgi:hypothetical protein
MRHYAFVVSMLCTVLATLPPVETSAQTLFINEFMASNSVTITDPDFQEYGDWLELYNPGDAPVNLRGFSITDLFALPRKYVFEADLIVPARGCYIIWTDDHSVNNHANFKLSASGEMIGLFDPAGNVVDTVTFGAQANDVSSGRYPNGSPNWYHFSPASPGILNSDSQIFDILVPVQLSHQTGFYTGPFDVILTHPAAGAALRYTLDGRAPTSASPLYTGPIPIDSTRVLRTRAFLAGSLPGNIVTATYFINEPTQLPVFSMVTDPENLFSDTSGIYVIGTNGITGNCSTGPRNWNQEWERPVDLEFFEADRSSGFKAAAGVQIYGGCSRLYPQKSLAFYFRSDYGSGQLKYRLFSDLDLTEYNNFILRSSAQDWWRTMFRDGMVQTLIEQGMRLDYQDYRPSVLFINGQYWGIHNIREKLNEHYVEAHYGVNPDNIDLIEVSKSETANNGDITAYSAMMNFVSANYLALQANYDYITSIVDIDEYIDYNIAEIYSANSDWPGSNMKLWREREPGAKWRWMIYDLDFTFGGNANSQYTSNTLALATATNGPSWPNPPWSTLLLRRLLENTTFRNEFIQRFAVHINTTFERSRVLAVIDSLKAGIASEIPRHKTRWPQSLSLGTPTWDGNIQVMRDFATKRPGESIGHLVAKFGLAGTYTLIIGRNHPEAGRVLAHNIEIRENGSSNHFFKNLPLKVKAVAMPGYRFAGWEGVTTSAAAETTLVLSENGMLNAVFEPAPLTVLSPVINEINYKSSSLFDTEDWVEIYNPSPDPADLTGWRFRGEGSTVFEFPTGTVLLGREYLILSRDTVKFRTLRPEVRQLLGNTGFGLSSSGERVQLIDAGGYVVDEVAFSPGGAWATAPNGTGATLSLINPQRDNALAENWRASHGHGTPGSINDVYTRAGDEYASVPSVTGLLPNYPNPFNPTTIIRYGLSERGHVTLTVFNTLGQVVAHLVDEDREAGYHEVRFPAQGGSASGGDGSGLSSGVYLYRLTAGSLVQTRKMLLVR